MSRKHALITGSEDEMRRRCPRCRIEGLPVVSFVRGGVIVECPRCGSVDDVGWIGDEYQRDSR